MSTGKSHTSERRKRKELKVLELFDKGYSCRQIAKELHVSLRDVANYVHRISNKIKSPSTTSIMNEVILEYMVTGLRQEVNDLKTERDSQTSKLIY